MASPPDDRLTLLGQSPDDLPLLAAVLQDAILRAPDIAYDRRRRRLVLLVNRYRHEAGGGSRVRSALRLESVTAVQRRHWPTAPEAMLVLLGLSADGDWLQLVFAGGIALRARAEVIDIVVEDLGPPWATSLTPHHD